MNWLGDLCQREIEATDVVLDIGCGIMQATLDTIPSYPQTRLRCAELIGVDLFIEYLRVLKDRVLVVRGDILNAPIQERSADIVLLLDVLEHLDIEDAQRVLSDAEKIARKRIIVSTPLKWSAHVRNEDINAYGLGKNALQRHKTLISPSFLRDRGFSIRVLRSGWRLRFWKRSRTIFAIKDVP